MKRVITSYSIHYTKLYDRTIAESIELARADVTVRTSMMESRFLAGSPELFEKFHSRYMRTIVVKGTEKFIDRNNFV